jgi:hypothetical protein
MILRGVNEEASVVEIKRMSLVKPTLQTLFHIDFDWWQKSDQDWRVYLQGLLCPEHRQAYADYSKDIKVDFVDPETAEVQQVDGVQHILITHCAQQEGFITSHTAMVDAIFRLFLANGNEPMSTTELGDRLGRPPVVILKVLSSGTVYRGVRPVTR